MSAFNYLHELDKRFSSESNLEQASRGLEIRALHFKVGQYNLLVPLDTSAEVISNLDYSPIPLSRPWLLGIASRRGQLLTLIDLKNFLFNSEPIKKISGQRVITNKTESIILGLVVDQVVGLMNLQKAEFTDEYPQHWDDAILDILSGIYKENDMYFGVCDFHKMVSDKRFTQTQNSYN